jgi:hypothetical protein
MWKMHHDGCQHKMAMSHQFWQPWNHGDKTSAYDA